MDIVCVGDVGIDLYLPDESRHLGGITANVAQHLAMHLPPEDSISVISALGNDVNGQDVRGQLDTRRIDWRLREYEGRTPVQTIEVDAHGERHFTHYEAGVLPDLEFDTDDTACIAKADLLVAPVFSQVVSMFERLMAISTRGQVAVDFSDFSLSPDFALLERHLAGIHIAFFGMNPSDSENLRKLRALAKASDTLFIITLGGAGSMSVSARHDVLVDAVPVATVVDTTGAGDAYAAGFLSEYIYCGDVQAAMRQGANVAAAVVQSIGAVPK